MCEKKLVTFERSSDLVNLVGAPVLVDPAEYAGIHHAGVALTEDFGRVTRGNPNQFLHIHRTPQENLHLHTAIILGCVESCWMLKQLEEAGKIDPIEIRGKWESFMTAVVEHPIKECDKALVIAGSDKRAAIFDACKLSNQIGVSPYDVIPRRLGED